MTIETEYIEAYRQSDTDLYWVGAEFKLKNNLTPYLKTVIALRDSLGVNGNKEYAQNYANQIEPTQDTNSDLIVLKKALQANVAYALGNITESHLYSQQGLESCTKHTAPEIKAYANWIQATTYNYDGKTRIERFTAFFDQITFKGPRLNQYILVKCLLTTEFGQAKPQLTSLMARAYSKKFKETIERFLFLSAMENGNLDEAIQHYQIFSQMKFYFQEDNAINTIFEKNALLLDFYLKALKNETPHFIPVGFQAKSIERTGTDHYPTWLLTVKALLDKKSQEALYWARLEQKSSFSYKNIGFFQLNLIRAELCNQNIEGAENELKRLESLNTNLLILPFFKARLEFLKNNQNEAARHLMALGDYLEKYNGWGRLNLELMLSNELKPMDFLNMGRLLSSPLPVSKVSNVQNKMTHQPFKPLLKLDKIVGESIAIKSLKSQIDKIKDLDLTILITGETGTGKELIAECIHECSARQNEPFLKINCAAVSENLLESELFGHEKGAFTGAHLDRKGIFEEAGKGTVFLDEIGDISPKIQIALLRVLESNEIKPLGGNFTRKIQCRVIAATNADLAQLSKQNKFRQDLYFRLYRLPIQSPALRERKEDILYLANHFLHRLANQQEIPEFSSDLKEALQKYPWPGNIRELKNEIERMVLMNLNKKTLGVEDLDLNIRLQAQNKSGPAAQPTAPRFESEALNEKNEPQQFPSAFRRLEFIRQLFVTKINLTRPEVAKATGTSTFTATRDLKQLQDEKFIEKITPTPAPRTHYFRISQTK